MFSSNKIIIGLMTQLKGGYKIIALLCTDYLRDQTMLELSYKEYRLLGKVVHKLEDESTATIDLLRGTGFGGMGKTVLHQFIGAFKELEGTMNIPKVDLETIEIPAPVLEIVPIAIFV